ncbi:MAG: hypothetical protein IT424_08485 [Pirellulales bacterium]|nr:hypothetical protein [Pirellulales bacterium]
MARTGGQVGGHRFALALCALAACGYALLPAAATGQTRIQFPTTPPTAAAAAPTVTIPGAATTPVNPYVGAAAPGGVAPFDPYSASGSAAYQFWSGVTPPTTGGLVAQPAGSLGATTPLPAATGSFPTYGPPPPTPTPPSQFILPNGAAPQFDLTQSIRFIQDIRLRHTYVAGGNDPNDLGINDSEVAITFTVPNFLTTGQPLFISPAFALHLWDGPKMLPADLPPNAYSAYLDFQWASDPALQVGAELGFRIGVYTDFRTMNQYSLRLQGLGLGVFRLTPTLTAKIGVMYLDRNKIKILPAGGLLWTPTPHVRFDIFFPQPKLSSYLMTVGKSEVWWYLAGEYGGGAWTIQRADGISDRVDINDIRVSAGLEWLGPRFNAFAEAGFVFKRQVIYVVRPQDSFDPGDTWMVRAGISF